MVDRERIRRSYDDLAGGYGKYRSPGDGTAVLRAFLDDASPERVLDAGCGNGRPILARLVERADAVGLDHSEGMLRVAREHVTAPLVQGDMIRLPFATGAFDAVVAYWSLIHLPLSDHPTAIEEFARVLRPGGRALVCEGSQPWVGDNPDWLDGVEMEWAIAGAERTREQLRDAGFAVTQTWGVPETLGENEEADSDLGDDDPAWTFLAAELVD